MLITHRKEEAREAPTRTMFYVIQIMARITIKTRLGLQAYPKMAVFGELNPSAYLHSNAVSNIQTFHLG